MPTRKNMVRMLIDLRHECKLSVNPAHNRQVHDEHVYVLQQAQEDLWLEFEWPFLKVDRDLAVTAGQRYVTPPADIGIDNIDCVHVRYGEVWCPLTYGIGAEQYGVYESALDERTTPIERWCITENDLIEVWPLPADATNATTLEGTLRVSGKKALSKFIDEDDQCDLDARDIVLFAASKIARGDNAKDVNAKWKLRHAEIRASLSNADPVPMFGIGKRHRGKVLRGPPRVHYRVTS